MNPKLTDAEFDAALDQPDDSILPSFGFTGSVMAAVQSEASAPPPIPFPWERAVPGAAAAAVMLGVLMAALISAFRSGTISTAAESHWQTALTAVLRHASAPDALWLMASIFLVLACLVLSRGLIAPR